MSSRGEGLSSDSDSNPNPKTQDPEATVAGLAACREPYLIGVRHHSPALASAMAALLTAAAPDVLLIELPTEAAPWLPWLAHEATQAPIALAGRHEDGGLAFYPFADFSPELAALRWARDHGVDVVPFDLPLAAMGWSAPAPATTETPTLARTMRAALSGRPADDLWDRLVEAHAPGCDAEQVRRAALAVGWAFREDAVHADAVEPRDLRREEWMRGCLAACSGRRVAVVAGAFHIPALARLDDAAADAATDADTAREDEIASQTPMSPAAVGRDAPAPASADTGSPAPASLPVVPPATVRAALESVTQTSMSLVPYTFALLDERSGYPAGIRDPAWQQAVFEASGVPDRIEAALAAKTVAVCARLRAAGHPAGPAEAIQILRFAIDLASLRGLPAPARGELVEALQSVLTHGETLGRGRAVAQAMSTVLIGDGRGRVAPHAPRSGLRPAVLALLAELGLPGPGDTARDVRLDPLRSALDRRREIALRRLLACGVAYAEPSDVVAPGGAPALTRRWRAAWTPSVEAAVDLSTVHGVTVEQAAEGRLRQLLRAENEAGGPTAAETLAGLTAAAECGLPALAAERLRAVAAELPSSATLAELASAADLVDALRLGHIAGLADTDITVTGVAATGVPVPGAPDLSSPDLSELSAALDAAAISRLVGLKGSDDIADARTLAALAARASRVGGELRLDAALRHLEADGSPLIAGAAAGARALIGTLSAERLGTRAAGWVDGAAGPDARTALRRRLTGLLSAAEPLLAASPELLDPLAERIESLPDATFLERLPALRGGFAAVSPAGRDRILAIAEQRLGQQLSGWGTADSDPDTLLAATMADRAGIAAVLAAGLAPPSRARASAADGTFDSSASNASSGTATLPTSKDAPAPAPPTPTASTLPPTTRWRLLLGRDRHSLPPHALRYATALDELYGAGRGEGEAHGSSNRGGRGRSYPSVREWSADLSALFGGSIREEVLGEAAWAGRLDAIAELDPRTVRPSVELLRSILSLAGGLSESAVAKLRPLVAAIVADLAKQLADRLRPALTGLTSPRPTSRPSGALDLARTVRANMATARRAPDGAVTLLPERPVFHTRARRESDWRIILVVDVSGSMESSVIWSALTAAVFAAVPALTTHFLAFSTEVVDLTDRAPDPLSLLLEVRVGGGTHIAAGLAAARGLVTVPSRTMVVLISDFEEGPPVGGLLGEVRRLAESGCTLLGCASLDDGGRPCYSTAVAGSLVAAGMPVAALSPAELAAWVGEKVRSR